MEALRVVLNIPTKAKPAIDSTACFALQLEQFKDGASGFLPFW
jgi:hypothetical protein